MKYTLKYRLNTKIQIKKKKKKKNSARETNLKGEVSREFGIISKIPKRLIINRNLKVLLKFDVNY